MRNMEIKRSRAKDVNLEMGGPAGPNNASIIPGDLSIFLTFPSHRATLFLPSCLFLCSIPSKMSDWTSDANESLTLSLGKHIHFHKLHSNSSMGADGLDNSEIARGQRYPWRGRVIRNISPFLHISGMKASCLCLHIQLMSGFIQLVALDLWRRRENLWLS